jgi:hypothetical protein
MNNWLNKYKPYMSGLAFAIALIALVIMLATL